MDKESLRKQAAGRVTMELILTADEARRSGRWAKGAGVLEQAAQDVVVSASKPEERQIKIEVDKLSWLKAQK